MTVPAAAVTAAGNAMREKWLADHPGIGNLGLDPMDWAAAALEAAAPLMCTETFTDGFIDGVAAEKERIRHLAIRHNVTVHACLSTCHDSAHSVLFAELLATPEQRRAEHLRLVHVDAKGRPVPCWHYGDQP